MLPLVRLLRARYVAVISVMTVMTVRGVTHRQAMVTKFFEVIELCKCARMRLCVHARVRAAELCERARECVACARVFLRVYCMLTLASERAPERSCAAAYGLRARLYCFSRRSWRIPRTLRWRASSRS
jgi:predicted DNA-binding ribbon-helix-helix protein